MRADHIDETTEQIMAVGWAGRCFGMVLDRESRFIENAQTFVRTVKQADMGHLNIGWQSLRQNLEAVVLRCDLDFPGDEVFNGLVRAAMA